MLKSSFDLLTKNKISKNMYKMLCFQSKLSFLSLNFHKLLSGKVSEKRIDTNTTYYCFIPL